MFHSLKASVGKESTTKQFRIRIQDVPDCADEVTRIQEQEYSPGSMADVVRVRTGERELVSMRWGFNMTIQGKKKMVFNTKTENVMNSPLWRKRFTENRCIVPASCFLEWPNKVKTAINIKGQELIGFAALWGQWANPKTNLVEPAFSIFTTEPNAVMQSVHNRQPVILNPSEYDEWLEPTQRGPVHLLRVFSDEVTVVAPFDAPEPTLFG